MVTLLGLIKATPFSEKNKEELVGKLDQMSGDQKFRLSEICWTSLSSLYQLKLQRTIDVMMQEMAEGKKTYSKNDFQEVKAKLYYEFAQKLESAESEAEISEVKEKLESYKSPTVSPPK